MRRAVHQMKDESECWKELVEFGQMLPDEWIVFVWHPNLMHFCRPLDEEGLRLVVEPEVVELGELVRRSRAPGKGV